MTVSDDTIGCCPTCGYDLRGTTGDRCPECGSPADVARQPRLGAMPDRLRRAARLGACLLAFDVACDALWNVLDLPNLFTKFNPNAAMDGVHLDDARGLANLAGVLLLAGPRVSGGDRRLARLAIALSATQATLTWVRAPWIGVSRDFKLTLMWLAVAGLALVLPTYGRPIFRRVPDSRAAVTAGWLRWAMSGSLLLFCVAPWAAAVCGRDRDVPDCFTAAGDATIAALDGVALWLLWRLIRGTRRSADRNLTPLSAGTRR